MKYKILKENGQNYCSLAFSGKLSNRHHPQMVIWRNSLKIFKIKLANSTCKDNKFIVALFLLSIKEKNVNVVLPTEKKSNHLK